MVWTASAPRCANLSFRPIVNESPICIHWTPSALKSGGSGRLYQYFMFVRSAIMPGRLDPIPRSSVSIRWKQACQGSRNGEHSEATGSLFRGNRNDRDFESFADSFRDVTRRHTLIMYRVIRCQPGAVFSTASRYKCATSFTGAAAHRNAPSSTYAETPSRARSESVTRLILVCRCHAPATSLARQRAHPVRQLSALLVPFCVNRRRINRRVCLGAHMPRFATCDRNARSHQEHLT